MLRAICFRAGAVVAAVSSVLGCRAADPAAAFIAQMDQAPPEKRVPNYPQLRAKMMRPAPAVGTPAPDFTLATADGGTSITRSTFASGKPLVLIFGSWT